MEPSQSGQEVRKGCAACDRTAPLKTTSTKSKRWKVSRILMKETKIQWCHSTVNPCMGCEGCELWPKTVKFVSELVKEAKALTHRNEGDLKSLVQEIVGSRSTSQIYQERKLIAETIAKQLKLSEDGTRRLVDVIRLLSKETLNKAHLTKFILA